MVGGVVMLGLLEDDDKVASACLFFVVSAKIMEGGPWKRPGN